MTLLNSYRYLILLYFMLMTATTNAFVTPSVRTIHPQQTTTAGSGASTTTTQLHFFNFGKKPDEKKKVVETPKKEEKPKVEEEDLDPIEKIFSFFFGKPEEEPFGLKRFGAARFPEQYPATVDEWAEPLEGDSPDVAKLRPLLKNTNMEFRGLTLSYDANKNGWNALKFHQACDRKGGALVVATTQTGQVCGYVMPFVVSESALVPTWYIHSSLLPSSLLLSKSGYNPKGWVGYGEARGSIAAFLFTRNRDGSYMKLRKVGGAGLAQM